MATTRLKLYNESLRNLGERSLATLNDSVESRRKLDEVWDGEAIRTVLQHGQWNFACRSTKLEHDPAITPDFGFQYAFDKPTDFVRVMGVCQDEYFDQPLLRYQFEAGYFFADLTPIYVRYVSDDASYGADYSLWPENFARYAACWLAREACLGITHDDSKLAEIEKRCARRLSEAKATDAMEQPTKFPPPSSWVRARHGRGGVRETTSGTVLD